MRKLFADAVYWIALINPADQWFEIAQNIGEESEAFQIVMSVEFLTETLSYYAQGGAKKT